jgi:hypothetical protein
MFPALALLAGAYLVEVPSRALLTAQCLLLAALGMLLGSGLLDSRLAASALLAPFAANYQPWLAAAAVVLVASGALGAASAMGDLRDAAVVFIAGGTLAASLLCLAGHRVFAPAYSVSQLAAHVPPGVHVYAVDVYDHSMPWSLRRTVTMVRHKDELAASIGWEPQRYLPDLASFKHAWTAERQAYAFVGVGDFERLRLEQGVAMEEVARGPRYVLARKP